MSDDKERGGLKGLADKAQDMVGGMVGMASASTAGSHNTEAFIANACMGDLYEVEAGRLAMQRALCPNLSGPPSSQRLKDDWCRLGTARQRTG